MLKIRRKPKGIDLSIPVAIPEPPVNSWVLVSDHLEVRFEQVDVDGVEADEGHVQADVGFGRGEAVVEWAGVGSGGEM